MIGNGEFYIIEGVPGEYLDEDQIIFKSNSNNINNEMVKKSKFPLWLFLLGGYLILKSLK